MRRVRHATVLVGVGRLGQATVERVLQSMDGDHARIGVITGATDRIGADLAGRLDGLLRAGRAAGEVSEPRLDILVFAGALQGADDEMVSACDQCAEVVGRKYGAIFPPDRPPEQRGAAMQLLVMVPGLSPSEAARRALSRVDAVERWAQGRPAYPLLSRIWLLSQQSAAGTLTVDDVVNTAATFAVATVGSGLRDDEAVRLRLQPHARGEGLVGFVSAASLDVPEARLRRYAAGRAALDALGTLVERVERQVADPAVALAAVHALGHEEWLAPLHDGEAAERVRRLAWTLAGGAPTLPEEIRVGPFDQPEDIRGAFPVLFRPGFEERAFSQTDIAELDEALEGLDRAESAAAARLAGGLGHLLDGTLSRASGLRQLPEIEVGLRRVLASLADGDTQDQDPELTPARADRDPQRGPLEQAVALLPTPNMLRAVGGAVGLAAGFLATMAMVAWNAPDLPPRPYGAVVVVGAAAGPPPVWAGYVPWMVGLLVGVAAGVVFAWFAGTHTRRGVRQALVDRREALRALRDSGVAARPGRQADAQLRLRRRRLRRGARVSVDLVLQRLQAVRRTLMQARDRQRQALVDMGVVLGADAPSDDLGPLVGAVGPLHDWLVPPAVVGRWVARCRLVADPEVWADRLLEATWPPRGLSEDAPAADEDAVLAACREQVRPLVERSLFEEREPAEASGRTARAFAARVTLALARACEPKTVHGDPVVGLRPGQVLTVGPAGGRDVLAEALLASPVDLLSRWTDLPSPRLLFLRTWEGYTTADILRGTGLDGGAP